jgi:hypothetical protein
MLLRISMVKFRSGMISIDPSLSRKDADRETAEKL